MFPLPANIYFEIAAFLSGVIFWPSLKDTRLRRLMPFLGFIVLVELSGRFIRKELHLPNSWLYNISVPVEYLFYAVLFLQFYQKKISRLLAIWFLFIFPVWALINAYFFQGFFLFNSNFLKVGSFFMLVFSGLILIELLMKEELINPFRLPVFWIASGLFLFNAGEFAFNTFFDNLVTKWKLNEALFQNINNNLIFVLYTCIIMAIILSAWTTKDKISTSPSFT